jgi:hypothetical protein
VCVGLSESAIPSFHLPGEASARWGFRGDDGGCFEHKSKPGHPWPHGSSFGYCSFKGYCYAEGQGLDYAWKGFGRGDTVGCGIVWQENAVFFTLNGQRLGIWIANPVVDDGCS